MKRIFGERHFPTETAALHRPRGWRGSFADPSAGESKYRFKGGRDALRAFRLRGQNTPMRPNSSDGSGINAEG